MSRFPEAVVADLLADCKRHCCLCLRWRGRNLEIHHIEPVAEGGLGTRENGIPLCFDCHAEVESKSNMGRRFSAVELRRHRDDWFGIVRESPEKLLARRSEIAETGPLESLLAELRFNAHIGVEHSPMENAQFRRAIATNALESLDAAGREAVHLVYRDIGTVNQLIEARLSITGFDRNAIDMPRVHLQKALRDQHIPLAIKKLTEALA